MFILVIRDTQFPAVGKKAGLSLIGKTSGTLIWIPANAGIADSADLGFTYGNVFFEALTPELSTSGYYLRIWKKLRDREWKVVLDAMNY